MFAASAACWTFIPNSTTFKKTAIGFDPDCHRPDCKSKKRLAIFHRERRRQRYSWVFARLYNIKGAVCRISDEALRPLAQADAAATGNNRRYPPTTWSY